jgi:AcrR family transcriptional regulator
MYVRMGSMPAPLTRDRVLQAAVELADRGGLDALSMRKLAQTLGVEAMSLYNHVRSKEDLLNGVVDVVVGEIELGAPGDDWKSAMRSQALAARHVLLRHRWAPRVIESRTTMSPVLLRYMDTVVSILRRGGFSVDVTHHAMHVLGSRVLGFTQELFNDTSELDTSPDMAAIMAREMAATYPYITELASAVSHEGGLDGCDDDVEFAFGLDLVLDGLDRLRQAPAARRAQRRTAPANGDATPADAIDPNLVRQMRAMLIDVFDSVFESPRQRAARSNAVDRRA